MRKYISLGVSVLLLGCVENEPVQPSGPIYSMPNYIELETELSTDRDIVKTVDKYISLFFHADSENNINSCLFTPDNILFTTIRYEDRQCLYNASSDLSDHCILARRNFSKTKNCYFNYKKYLPEVFSKYTEADFLELVNIYKHSLVNKLNCLNNMQLTSVERADCAKRVEDYVIGYAHQKTSEKNNYKLKKCSQVAPKEYEEEFLSQSVDRFYETGKWFSQAYKDSICSGKGQEERKKVYKKYAAAHAECGKGFVSKCLQCIDFKCYSYVVDDYTPDYEFGEASFKLMVEAQKKKIADFGIKHNCYISYSQLQEENYNYIMKAHKAQCSRGVEVYYPKPPLEVRIVD